MSIFKDMIIRITDRYTKDPDSDIGKLIRIVAEEMEGLRETNQSLIKYQDIDEAVGRVLDRYGADVGQPRNGMDDDEYRYMIKTKDQANFSNGDIETINQMMGTLLDDKYLGLNETWTSAVHDNEPAAIEFELRDDAHTIPSPSIMRVIADAIQVYWHIVDNAPEIKISGRSYNFPVKYRICNLFQTADVPGGLAKAPININEKAYGFDVLYPICNTFVTSTISVEKEQVNVMLTEEYRNNDVLYKRAGETHTGVVM